jgi:hypothetical protein
VTLPGLFVEPLTGQLLGFAGLGLLAATVVLGEAGHVGLEQMNAVVARHFFHIIFPPDRVRRL